MEQIQKFFEQYIAYVPHAGISDVIEILLIAFGLYQIISWMRKTRAWDLMRGVLVIALMMLLASFFKLNTIVWIFEKLVTYVVIALLIILQPELRKALEQIGHREFLSNLLPIDTGKKEEGQISDRTIREIARACAEMGKVKTGALIVVEKNEDLSEYERTGIEVDGRVSSQLLINIFEKNTPLHDGAVIIRGDRVTSATCYLPLSDNLSLSKELGTRHRAGIGISEASDSMTVIVSEESGCVRVAYEGVLSEPLTMQQVEAELKKIQDKAESTADRKKLLGTNILKKKRSDTADSKGTNEKQVVENTDK